MEYVPVGDATIIVEAYHVDAPKHAFWTFGVHPDDSTATPTAIATACAGALGNPGSWYAASNTNNDVWFETVTAIKMTSTGPITGEYVAHLNGAEAWAAPPPQVAILAHKQTTRGGRRGRGRTYLPAFNVQESEITAGGVYTSTALLRMELAWVGFQTGLSDAGMNPVLFHTIPLDGSHIDPDPIVEWGIEPMVATQRRRLR